MIRRIGRKANSTSRKIPTFPSSRTNATQVFSDLVRKPFIENKKLMEKYGELCDAILRRGSASLQKYAQYTNVVNEYGEIVVVVPVGKDRVRIHAFARAIDSARHPGSELIPTLQTIKKTRLERLKDENSEKIKINLLW